MEKILILTDYRGYLATSLKKKDEPRMLDVELLKKELKKFGYDVQSEEIENVKFPNRYREWYILYPSSEEQGGFYKDYIEDILLRLVIDGNILLPEFNLFRAHDNKVFMELLRTNFSQDKFKTVFSMNFYSLMSLKEELKKNKIEYPFVIKMSSGSGSVGVKLIHNIKELAHEGKKLNRVVYFDAYFSAFRRAKLNLINLKRKITGQNSIQIKPGKKKIILQSFIENLSYDYKVLIFGSKYYILKRDIREHDFRASGSGKFIFPEELTEEIKTVLNFACDFKEEVASPMYSLDIAFNGSVCHLLEFQFVNFGPYTLEFSKAYYIKDKEEWERIEAESVLEIEMAKAVEQFICRNE